ncbi:hypothetical protein BESB_054650 [Besnoitia besnoiti]|uniref:Uncharacterized protein n=1 Tax=Besnoitia besnoiti TaxID=94643 RepID=A0A2A9MF32_BESBE|nr:hypothetical protein BESB_054650 [Besnoitia besnoiti]PFH35814.1 hypothetical protein BESB_054650 [Besnoitia besnoiti]
MHLHGRNKEPQSSASSRKLPHHSSEDSEVHKLPSSAAYNCVPYLPYYLIGLIFLQTAFGLIELSHPDNSIPVNRFVTPRWFLKWTDRKPPVMTENTVHDCAARRVCAAAQRYSPFRLTPGSTLRGATSSLQFEFPVGELFLVLCPSCLIDLCARTLSVPLRAVHCPLLSFCPPVGPSESSLV